MFSKLEKNLYNYKQVKASVYGSLTIGKHKVQVFTASIADINKALAKKKVTDLRTRLLD